MSEVILVNEQDVAIGTMEKMAAHREGLLHRAFSIFIFNSAGELLLQQRSDDKYHSAGLWTNTCCSHPAPGEETATAAHRRLAEEMGFDTELTPAFSFTYKSVFENGLTEHEFDHVFVGRYEGGIQPNEQEVQQYRYISFDEIREQIAQRPALFTSWFIIALPRIEAYMKTHF